MAENVFLYSFFIMFYVVAKLQDGGAMQMFWKAKGNKKPKKEFFCQADVWIARPSITSKIFYYSNLIDPA